VTIDRRAERKRKKTMCFGRHKGEPEDREGFVTERTTFGIKKSPRRQDRRRKGYVQYGNVVSF